MRRPGLRTFGAVARLHICSVADQSEGRLLSRPGRAMLRGQLYEKALFFDRLVGGFTKRRQTIN